MLSIRAKTIKYLLKATLNSSAPNTTDIIRKRRKFNRNLFLTFPSSTIYVQKKLIADVAINIITAKNLNTNRSIVYLHGGGFIFGTVKAYRQHLKLLAKLSEATVYAIDYSLAPEAVYPSALEQIQKVWQELTKNNTIDPAKASFIGDSAGGNLACASLLRFREGDITMPACLVLLSPALDGTFSGDSYKTNTQKDLMLNHEKINVFINAYIGKASRKDSHISPIFASLKGFPPVLIHVGSEEILLSDSITFSQNAKRDGVEATLEIGDGLWHVWHLFASYMPEAKRSMCNVAKFVKRHT